MTLPILGAALNRNSLTRWADWLREAPRDIEIQDFVSAATLMGDWRPLAAQIRDLLDGCEGRIGIHGPFWGLQIDSMDPEIGAIVGRRLEQGLEVCAALGATLMVVHSPFSTWDANNIDFYDGARDDRIERIRRNIGAAIRRAEDQGVVLALENIEDKFPADRREMIAALKSPALRLSVDTGHAHYAHGSTGAAPVDAFIRDAGALLAHVHLQDADGYADRHWAPGQGSIRWASVFKALAQLDHAPRLILELRDHEEIGAGAAYLKEFGLAA